MREKTRFLAHIAVGNRHDYLIDQILDRKIDLLEPLHTYVEMHSGKEVIHMQIIERVHVTGVEGVDEAIVLLPVENRFRVKPPPEPTAKPKP